MTTHNTNLGLRTWRGLIAGLIGWGTLCTPLAQDAATRQRPSPPTAPRIRLISTSMEGDVAPSAHSPARAVLLVDDASPAADPNPSPPEPTLPPPPVPQPLPAPETAALTNMLLRPAGPGKFELGKVTFDKIDRSVTFPAVVNMRGGLMEYFLVTTYGKTHESVFRTEAEPYHIHVAMLLLDARGAGGQTPAAGLAGPIEQPGLMRIGGDEVSLEVSWTTDGKRVRHAAHELVFNRSEKATMARGPWIYNGSAVIDGLFVAQRDGSIIALIADPYALVNNPRRGYDNDEIWAAHTDRLPELNHPVHITLRLKDQAAARPPSP